MTTLIPGRDMVIKAIDQLSPREREVASLVCKGMNNFEVGLALGISKGTVKFHMKNILEKLGVRNRYQMMVKLRNQGFGNE